MPEVTFPADNDATDRFVAQCLRGSFVGNLCGREHRVFRSPAERVSGLLSLLQGHARALGGATLPLAKVAQLMSELVEDGVVAIGSPINATEWPPAQPPEAFLHGRTDAAREGS